MQKDLARQFVKGEKNENILGQNGNLPLQVDPFCAQQTRIYFEGLLPEEFTRQSVARWMHVADYALRDFLISRLGSLLNFINHIFEKGGASVKRTGKIMPLYERLSRDDELQGESNSISNQKRLLEEYVKKYGLPNPTHFTDDGISGPQFDRPRLCGNDDGSGSRKRGMYLCKRFIPIGTRLSESWSDYGNPQTEGGASDRN
jgi:hypothetical protein